MSNSGFNKNIILYCMKGYGIVEKKKGIRIAMYLVLRHFSCAVAVFQG